jgi:hypothetical protein
MPSHENANFRACSSWFRTTTLPEERKIHGPDHPVVAVDLNNLASLLQATNRLSEAESLMRRALAIE